jgi:acyl dehydratase
MADTIKKGLSYQCFNWKAAMSLVTDDVRLLIGMESGPVACAEPLSEDALRRFVQAVMETNAIHWSRPAAAASRYGTLVAVPLYPLHAHRREPGTPDPFEVFARSPDADGAFSGSGWAGLPPVNVPLTRIVNGGTKAQFFSLAKVGDVITSRAKYLDIRERTGRTGPMVIIDVQVKYTNQDEELLAIITMTLILR